jgi:hypothetical protein
MTDFDTSKKLMRMLKLWVQFGEVSHVQSRFPPSHTCACFAVRWTFGFDTCSPVCGCIQQLRNSFLSRLSLKSFPLWTCRFFWQPCRSLERPFFKPLPVRPILAPLTRDARRAACLGWREKLQVCRQQLAHKARFGITRHVNFLPAVSNTCRRERACYR